MTVHYEPLIRNKQATNDMNDTILRSQNKNEFFSIIHEYHEMLRKVGLKPATKKNIPNSQKNDFFKTHGVFQKETANC